MILPGTGGERELLCTGKLRELPMNEIAYE
jgi:hypothetical protein